MREKYIVKIAIVVEHDGKKHSTQILFDEWDLDEGPEGLATFVIDQALQTLMKEAMKE